MWHSMTPALFKNIVHAVENNLQNMTDNNTILYDSHGKAIWAIPTFSFAWSSSSTTASQIIRYTSFPCTTLSRTNFTTSASLSILSRISSLNEWVWLIHNCKSAKFKPANMPIFVFPQNFSPANVSHYTVCCLDLAGCRGLTQICQLLAWEPDVELVAWLLQRPRVMIVSTGTPCTNRCPNAETVPWVILRP